MKKSVILFVALALVSGVSAKTKKEKKQKEAQVEEQLLTNAVDSMSYAFGMNLGKDLAKSFGEIPGGKINVSVFMKSFSEALTEEPTLLMSTELAQEYFQQYIAEQQEQANKAKRTEGEKFLAENAKRPEITTTPSGLQYEILESAFGDKPAASSKVTVHYEGTLLSGEKFDSSYDRGEPITFGLNQVIKGWTEGLQLMPKGSKYKFYIPYTLGYGERGAGQHIPAYATLIFVVELIDFQ